MPLGDHRTAAPFAGDWRTICKTAWDGIYTRFSEQEQEPGLEQEQKPEQEQLEVQPERKPIAALHFSPGDFVALAGLKAEKLNGAHGDVLESLASGRLRIKLDWRHSCKTVAIKIENVKLVSSAEDIAAAKRMRDDGLSVSCLLKLGFTRATIQRDDSNALCTECFRPRYMCSCLYSTDHGTDNPTART